MQLDNHIKTEIPDPFFVVVRKKSGLIKPVILHKIDILNNIEKLKFSFEYFYASKIWALIPFFTILKWKFLYDYEEAVSIYDGIVPKNILILQNSARENHSVISRSSILPAITDGVATAYRANLKDNSHILLGSIQACTRYEDFHQIKLNWRENIFLQAHIEIAARIGKIINQIDIEEMLLGIVIEIYNKMKIPLSNLQLRINDSTIGEIILVNLDQEKRSKLLDSINEIASQFQYKNLQMVLKNRKKSFILLKQCKPELSQQQYQVLYDLILNSTYNTRIMHIYFPETHILILRLLKIQKIIQNKFPEINCIIDPLSFRLGYTGLTMQVDAIFQGKTFPEIGGGGFYTMKAHKSWERQFNTLPPSDFIMGGFAIGLKRVQAIKKYEIKR